MRGKQNYTRKLFKQKGSKDQELNTLGIQWQEPKNFHHKSVSCTHLKDTLDNIIKVGKASTKIRMPSINLMCITP